eukprot:2772044-Prymnesium_polylepis.1
MGSSGDHFGTSLVTLTSRPRAARRLTVTTSQRFSDTSHLHNSSLFDTFSKFNPPVESPS